jgi:hypothetical protein
MARKPVARRVLIAVLLAIAGGIGCNPFLAPLQLFGLYDDPKAPCRFNFYDRAAAAKKKKDITVVVFANQSPSVSLASSGADQGVAAALIRKLAEMFAVNKERVNIVPLAEVEKFKRTHDDWKVMPLSEIGKYFHADYIVEIEVTQMSLYEPKTRDIFRGHCRIGIKIVDAIKDGEPFDKQEYSTEYPGNGQVVPMDMETDVEKFKARFFARIALDITGLFTPVPAGSDRFQ